jgi:hypothetical protein
MIFETQISSRWTPENPGVFAYKERLGELGIATSFPKGAEILLYTAQGFAITTEEERTTPFDKTQVDFLRSIRRNDLHIVYNVHGDDRGYLGESTSVETAYALALRKPILLEERQLLHFGEKVNPAIAEIIDKNVSHMDTYSPMDSISDALDWKDAADTIAAIAKKRGSKLNYDMTDQDRRVIMLNALDLTRKYRQAWNEFTSSKKPISSTPHQ